MDDMTPEQRRKNMQHIRSKDTSIEVQVRKELFARGFRFRKNDKRYAGKPDIVLPKYQTVIFVNGCYWHRHIGCKYATTPSTNVDYWTEKFQRTVLRDKSNIERLEHEGWHVIVLWECQLKDHFNETMNTLIKELILQQSNH